MELTELDALDELCTSEERGFYCSFNNILDKRITYLEILWSCRRDVEGRIV